MDTEKKVEPTKTYEVKPTFEARDHHGEWHKEGSRFTAPASYEVPDMPVPAEGGTGTRWVSPVVEITPTPEPEPKPVTTPKNTKTREAGEE